MTPNGARFPHARRSGQGLVELALILPILFLLVLGVVEFARAWNLHQVLTDATREATRTAAVHNETLPIDSVYSVVNHAIWRARFDSTAETTTIDSYKTGTYVTVSIAYPHRLRIIQGLMQWTTGDATFTLRASTTMRNE